MMWDCKGRLYSLYAGTAVFSHELYFSEFHHEMFSFLRAFILTEGKRFAKYVVVGALTGGITGGTCGYLVLEALLKETEEDFKKHIRANVPVIFHPLTFYGIEKVISIAKKEGVEVCAVQGFWYGAFAGSSLGITRVIAGTAIQLLRYTFKRTFK